MKHQLAASILGFTLFLFSSCTVQDDLLPIQEYLAITTTNTITTGDSIYTRPIIPIQYRHILGKNYLKLLYPEQQVGEYVRRVFEDKSGNLWFGTNGEGVCRFDGKGLSYYSTHNGLSGSQVTAIMEDAAGNIWCATGGGVTKFVAPLKANAGSNGNDSVWLGFSFTNFTTANGLPDNWVWSLYQDRKGTIWAGTLKGLCRFDGTKFISVPLPATQVEHPAPDLSLSRVGAITEDKAGNLWFGTDGGGAYRYDGKSFTNFTSKDGLCDNNISCIVKDSKGNLWIGSMYGGLSRYDGESFTSFAQKDGMIGNNEVWNIYEDKKGNIWFSSEGFGVYRYDGKNFTNFGEKEGLGIKAVQTIYEDSKGRLWIGGGGGLYRFDGKDTFFNVTRDGLTDGC